MDPKIIDGREIAKKRAEALKEKVTLLKRAPKVVSILVGNDPPSVLYTNMKQKKAAEVGIIFEPHRLPEETDFYSVSKLILALNADPKIDGVMIQLPLPKTFLGDHKTKELIELIKKDKDVDGLRSDSPFLTAAVEAVFIILEEEKIDIEGKYVVMVGASELIGQKIAEKLTKMGAMVKLCNSKTDLKEFTKRADILISATGKPHLITGDMVKTGVVVIDVGVMVISPEESERPDDSTNAPISSGTTVTGDVDFESVLPKAYKITPVPGGVGPVTVISLLENVYKAASTNK